MKHLSSVSKSFYLLITPAAYCSVITITFLPELLDFLGFHTGISLSVVGMILSVFYPPVCAACSILGLAFLVPANKQGTAVWKLILLATLGLANLLVLFCIVSSFLQGTGIL